MDAPRPAFTLTDTDGRAYDFADETAGRVTLLFFGYTSCPDFCPLHMATIGGVLGELSEEDRQRVRVVFVTVDPEHDTAARLRGWLDRFGEGFVGLRGEAVEVDSILSALRLSSVVHGTDEHGEATIGHTVRVLAFPADDAHTLIYASDTLSEDLRHDLPILLAESS